MKYAGPCTTAHSERRLRRPPPRYVTLDTVSTSELCAECRSTCCRIASLRRYGRFLLFHLTPKWFNKASVGGGREG